MTKRLEIQFRRHPHSYRSPEGKKFDGPSLQGLDEIRRIALPLDRTDSSGYPNEVNHQKAAQGEYALFAFYASPMYRTHISAELLREHAIHVGQQLLQLQYALEIKRDLGSDCDGFDGVRTRITPQEEQAIVGYLACGQALTSCAPIITAPAIRPTTRSPEYEKAMKAACPSGKESDLVAYSLNPDNLTAGTESPAELGQRNLDHILGLRSHFEQVPNGKIGYIENITHEPNLTAVMMRVLDMERYDAARFQGAANTTETIAVTMEQRSSGIVDVRMQYRNLEASLTL